MPEPRNTGFTIEGIHDNHVHLDGEGLGPLAARVFKRAGGSSLTVITTYSPEDGFDFPKIYENVQRQSMLARKEGVGTFVALGPHPNSMVDILNQNNGDIEQATEIFKDAIDLAAKHIRDQKGDLIGEVGFATNFDKLDQRMTSKLSEIKDAEKAIMRHALEAAKDLECPIDLHTPTATPQSLKEWASLGKEIGVPKKSIIQHFCKPLLDFEENFGVTPSIICHDSNIRKLKRHPLLRAGEFFLETDYMDYTPFYSLVCPIQTTVEVAHTLVMEEHFTPEEFHKLQEAQILSVYKRLPSLHVPS